MASLIYNSLLGDIVAGDVDFGSDTFYVMLVTSAYTPDKDTDTKRSDVTGEVSGDGYPAGGDETTVTVEAVDNANDRLDIVFTNVLFTEVSGFTAVAAVIYKRRGGVASADELVAYVDFGNDVEALGGDYTVSFDTPLRLQN